MFALSVWGVLERLYSLENAGIIHYYKYLLVGEIHIPEILQYKSGYKVLPSSLPKNVHIN